MLLNREELAYDLPGEKPGSYQPPQPSRWRQSPIFVPIAYDMQRRLNLMRASKAHVKRGGFQQDCQEIAKLTPDQLMQAIAKLGEGADFRSIIHDEAVPETVRKAVKALVPKGTEHRSGIRSMHTACTSDRARSSSRQTLRTIAWRSSWSCTPGRQMSEPVAAETQRMPKPASKNTG